MIKFSISEAIFLCTTTDIFIVYESKLPRDSPKQDARDSETFTTPPRVYIDYE